MPPMPHIPLHTGLAALADRYDAVILDLWGVVHDGVAPYPTAPECMAALRDAGKKVCLLSNAPRRVASAAERLQAMGIVAGRHYDALMTSGEATHEALMDPPDAWHAALGRRMLHIGPERDTDIYDTIPVGHPGARLPVTTVEDADFILNTGVVDYAQTVADFDAVLRLGVARGLPMLCANPDRVVHIGPDLVLCAGELAHHYAALGGDVRQHGKPFPGVYARCFHHLGDVDPTRVLAVGDSLSTDVAGANAAGIDVLLVTGGIHRGDLASSPEGMPDRDRLDALVAASGHTVTGALTRLAW